MHNSFLQGKTEILHLKQDILEENIIMYRKSDCIVKKTGFRKKYLNFTMKTRFSIEENSIMYRKSGCIVKKTVFTRKD